MHDKFTKDPIIGYTNIGMDLFKEKEGVITLDLKNINKKTN